MYNNAIPYAIICYHIIDILSIKHVTEHSYLGKSGLVDFDCVYQYQNNKYTWTQQRFDLLKVLRPPFCTLTHG